MPVEHDHKWYLYNFDIDADGLPISPQIACHSCDELLKFQPASLGSRKLLDTEAQELISFIERTRNEITGLRQNMNKTAAATEQMREQKKSSIHQLEREVDRLDKEEAEQRKNIDGEIEALKLSIATRKAPFLKQISLTSIRWWLDHPEKLQELAKHRNQTEELDGITIFQNPFIRIVENIAINDKPVNCRTYRIQGQFKCHYVIYEPIFKMYPDLEKFSGYGYHSGNFYDKDFKTDEDAHRYGEKNRLRLIKTLVETLQQIEKQLEATPTNLADVFDFRLLDVHGTISTNSRHDQTFQVKDAQKLVLVVTPLRKDWNTDKHQPEFLPEEYDITVTMQSDGNLKIDGNRHEDESEQLLDYITDQFNIVKPPQISLGSENASNQAT